jgi:hypothetical protein
MRGHSNRSLAAGRRRAARLSLVVGICLLGGCARISAPPTDLHPEELYSHGAPALSPNRRHDPLAEFGAHIGHGRRR